LPQNGSAGYNLARAENFRRSSSGLVQTSWDPLVCWLLDGLKLVFEDVVPAKADSLLFTLGPIIVVIPVFLSYLIVPFGQNLVITNEEPVLLDCII